MTSSSIFKILTLAGVIVCAGGAWAEDYSNHADNWTLNGTILTNTVSDWAFNVSVDNKKNVTLSSIANMGTNKTTVVDFSALTNATTACCRLTGFGNTVFHIDGNIYKGNTSITSLKMPFTVTTVDNYALQYCSSLTYFSDFSKITSIGHSAFKSTALSGEIYLPALTNLSQNAFQSATKITHVEIPKVTTINVQTFNGCSSLTSVVLRAATSIEGSTFYDCSALTNVVLPSVTKLSGNYVFYNASSLERIELPQVTIINTYKAFGGCSSLKYIDLPSIISLSDTGVNGASNLRVIKLPYCLTTVGSSSFHGNMTSVYIHRCSPLAAGLIDGTKASGAKKEAFIPYGGTVSKDGVDWIYDDAVWNPETKIYDIQSTNVTIVAAPGATNIIATVDGAVVTNDVQIAIPRSLPIKVTVENEDGASETIEKTVPVTAIEDCAFKNNVGLICVTVPKTVTDIGVGAFPKGCYIKIKDSPHALDLVRKLNDEYGKVEGTEDEYYASVDTGSGLMIILR